MINGKAAKHAVLMAALLVLSGCVSMEQRRSEFTASMDAWVGKSLDELVQAKGPPTGSFTLSSGKRVIEYLRKDTMFVGGDAMTTMTPVFVPNGGGWVYVPQQAYFPARSTTLTCKIVLTVTKENVIESWRAEGNDCY